MQRPMAGLIGVADPPHQPVLGGEMPPSVADQASERRPGRPPTGERRPQDPHVRRQTRMLAVNQGVAESGYGETHWGDMLAWSDAGRSPQGGRRGALRREATRDGHPR